MTRTAKTPSEKSQKLLVVAFFLLLTLVGVCTSADYGVNFDALWEIQTLEQNVHEYAYQLLGENSDLAQSFAWKGTERISQSSERDHGQSAFYAAVPLLKVERLARDWFRPVWNAYTFLVFMAGVFAVYAFCREMGMGRLLSACAALLMYLCPRFFAEGHYNTKDLALLSLQLLTLWLGLRFLKKPGALRALCFSFLGAMAANTRIAGALPWGLVCLGAVAMRFARKDWSLRLAGVAALTALSFAGFYALLTPALWQNPAEYLAYVLRNSAGFSRWSYPLLFQGQLYDQTAQPLPFYYLPYLMFFTLPLYALPLLALGQGSVLRNLIRQKAAFFQDARQLSGLLLTALWLGPLCYAMAARPLMYNSWRHFYFLFAGMVLLMSLGLHRLSLLVQSSQLARRGGAALLLLCLLGSALGIALNHPYQYGYYNPLAPRPLAPYLELDYWEVSSMSALRQLYDRKATLPYPAQLSAQDELTALSLKSITLLPKHIRSGVQIQPDAQSPYLLQNATYATVYGLPPPQGYHELFRLQSYGSTLCTVYEKDLPPLPETAP